VLSGVFVAGGGAGAEECGCGDQLPRVGREHWGVEEFGARGGELVGAEEIAWG